ncbi:MAG: acyl-CoA thioesterase II [Burkholderiaceae bacterium]
MTSSVDDLIDLLTLEEIDANLFRGQSLDFGSKRVFGGQVLGQALSAANRTVDERVVHSLHAYFLRGGDPEAPIIYEVDRQRDGRTYASRRVVAIQHGRPILNLAASFQSPEQGLEHQDPMPAVPAPADLKDMGEYRREFLARMPESKLPRFLLLERPFEFRPVEPPPFIDPGAKPARSHIWFRTVERLPDDDDLHRNVLTYLSDYSMIVVATRPHGAAFESSDFQLTSLDHALWFQRPFRVDEWLLYAVESPSATGARGFVNGRIYCEDGTLVALVAQEGVMRVFPKAAAS